MPEPRPALLRLLEDDDPETLSLVQREMIAAGRLEELRALLPQASAQAARRLREMIGAMEVQRAEADFRDFCADFGEDGDLEEAAWRLAAAFFPREDFSRQRALLDAWAAEVRRRLAKATSAVEQVETLVEYLGGEVGLQGNVDDYYNLNNSLLPEVIETRRGIPIVLSLIYLFVARRVDLEAEGVGFPGHFIVRFGEHFFDPFHGGRRLGIADCRALAEQQGFELRAEHFAVPSPRAVLTRMLGNIIALAREADPAMASRVGKWIDALHGEE